MLYYSTITFIQQALFKFFGPLLMTNIGASLPVNCATDHFIVFINKSS